MSRKEYLATAAGVAAGATAALLSARGRRVVRAGTAALLAAAMKAGSVAVRGTRNLQEESKHVTRFGDDDAEEASTEN